MRAFILSVFLVLCIQTSIAQDVAVVTATNGYLLDRSGKVERLAQMYEAFSVVGQTGDFYEVQQGKQSARIHRGQVHLLNADWQAEAHPYVFSILTLLQDVNAIGSSEKAAERLNGVLKQANRLFEPDSPIILVVQSAYAAELAFSGNISLATEQIGIARKRVKQLKLQNELVAAEVANADGLIAFQRGKWSAAKKKFTNALEIAERILGKDHQDVAVYLHNRVLTADVETQFQGAEKDLLRANSIYQKVFPVDAIEQPRGLMELGELYLEAEQPIRAIGTLTSALGMIRTWHLDQPVDLARCQFDLGDSWYQREQFPEAERWYNSIDLRLPEGASAKDIGEMRSLRKEIQHALGDIDFERNSLNAALAHYMNAVELSDNNDLETLDGWSFTYAADTLAEMGEQQRAHRIYKGAWLVFEKTDGPKSQLALDAKTSYEEAGGMIAADSKSSAEIAMNETLPTDSPKTPSSRISTETGSGSFIRAGETMLKTTVNAPIMDGSKVLTRVPPGTRLWRLETSGDWFQVIVPGEDRRAWISKNSVQLQVETQAKDFTVEVNQRANDPKAAGRLNQQMLTLMPQISETIRTQGLAAAVPLQEKLVTIYEEAVGDKHFLTASGKTLLATYYYQTRQFVKSRDVTEAALPALREVHGEDHPVIAVQLNRLAGLLGMVGDTPGRQRCLAEATSIAVKHFGSDDNRTLNFKLNLAAANADIGQLDQAEEFFGQVQRLSSGENGYAVGELIATAGLGMVRILRRKFEEAIPILQQADELCQIMGDPANFKRGEVADAMAIAFYSKGDRDQAMHHEQLAVELWEAAGADESYLLAAKARLAILQEDWDESLRLSEKMRSVSTEFFGEESGRLSGPLTSRGIALARLGRLDEATDSFEQARQISTNHVVNVLADLPVSHQIAYLKTQDNALLHSALSLGLHAPDNARITTASMSWLLNTKNIANELAARDIQVRRLLTADSHVTDYEKWLDSRRRLATLPPLTQEEAQDEHIKVTELRLNQSADTAYSRLPVAAQKFLEGRQTPWVTASQIRASLAKDEVFIDVVRMRKRQYAGGAEATTGDDPFVYAAWIVSADSTVPVRVVELRAAEELEKQVVRPYLDKVMSSVGKISELGEDGALVDLIEINQRLNQKIWAPIAQQLPTGTRKLVLCPDSALWEIPWAAIEQTNRKLLLEDYVIRFVSSGRDLLRPQLIVADLQPPTIIADPDYGVDPEEIEDDLGRMSLRSLSIRLDNVDATLLKNMLPDPVLRLKGTGAEAMAVQPLMSRYSGMKAEMFLRKAASETALRLTRRPHTLFVGTHGFFWPEEDLPEVPSSFGSQALLSDSNESNQRNNPLRRCGLLLAGCSSLPSSKNEEQLDGIVTGAEIVGLDLQGTKLVVLSACETGVGDLTSGQGVAGLRQAVQLAGAESVVSTLWQIPDSETEKLMTAYFEHLAHGNSRATSLRLAQLDRLHARRERNGAAHPFFWAAFTLTGQD